MSIQLDIETNLHLNGNIAGSDQVIYFVDGPVGSHKTSSMYRFVAACPQAKFTIGTPTNSMTDQIAGGLEAVGVSCLPIHRDNGKKQGSAARYRTALMGGTRVIAINHDVALKLVLDKMDCDFIKNPDLFAPDDYSDIELIIDEILSVYKRFTLKGMTLSNEWVSTYFNTLKPNENSEYYHLTLNERGRAAWAKGFLEEQQPLSQQQRAIFDHTLNEHYRVAVSVNDFKELNRGKRTSLSFFVTVRPSVLQQYRSATIIGANFKKSMLYKMWKDEVNFQPHPYIKGDYDDFSHKHKLSVVINHYYFCEPTFSKTRLNVIGHENVFDKAAPVIESILKQNNQNQDVPYIFAVNNPEKEGDSDYRWITEVEEGFAERISANPRGQNGHKDKHASVFLAAVNFSNIDTAYLQAACNISPSEAREAMTFENISQFHGRTSIRIQDADDNLYFFSPDRDSAIAMREEFGGEEPIFIDLGFEEFRYSEDDDRTDYERQADYKANRNNVREDKRWSNEDTREYDDFTLAVWMKRGDSFPNFLEGLKWQDILHFIEDQTKSKRSKTNLPQIREGFFKDHSNHRTSGNIEATKMLQMDVDASEVHPETFSKFLADELGLTHVIYNSINSTEENPRFHFLMPLDKAVNRSVHERIFAMVAEQIAAEYEGVEFKLEVDRKSINHPIYSACLPKRMGGEIFIAREAAFLDVDAHLARRPSVAVPAAQTTPATKSKNKQVAKIDHLEAIRIVSEIALEHAKPQHRDAAFKLAGQALIYTHKMPAPDAIQVLETTLHMFGKDRDAPRRLVNSLVSADGYQKTF